MLQAPKQASGARLMWSKPSSILATGEEYTIERHAHHPQAGDAYSYRDGKRSFWFYVQLRKRPGQKGYELVIPNATLQKFMEGVPKVEPEECDVIEHNIRQHLRGWTCSGPR
jgi:hypothetical protein